MSDIAYITTNSGWTYLATVMDAHSQKFIGWSLSESLERSLVINVLQAAMTHRGFLSGVLLHSDRGSKYASEEYVQLISQYGCIQSMNRKGNCWDNAPMEGFYDSLKAEYVHDMAFDDFHDAFRGIFQWIEIRYNRQRMHSSLGYRSPACFEEEIVAQAA